MELLIYDEVFFLVSWLSFVWPNMSTQTQIFDLISGFISRLNNAIILVVDEVSVDSEAPTVNLLCLVLTKSS